MKKQLLLTLLLTFSILLTTNAPVFAQVDLFGEQEEEEEEPKVLNPYDDKYKANIEPEKIQGQSLLPNFIHFIGILRKPGADPDTLNFMVLTPGMVNGCLNIEQATVETRISGSSLYLDIVDGSIFPDNETVHYFHYECKPSTNKMQIDIALSKKKLMKDGIKKLVFKRDVGTFNDIFINVKENSVSLASSMRDFSSPDLPMKGEESTYWIHPENTLVLFSSDADLRDEETMKQVRALARKKGLTPLDEILPGYKPHYQNAHKLYAVDVEGHFTEKLPPPNGAFSFGAIEATELYFGADGPYDKPITKEVFARKPGLYE